LGHQTVVILRNDAIDHIRAHPQQFVEQLLEATDMVASGFMPDGVDFPTGNHGNPGRVVAVHHSDNTAIITSGGGTAKQLALIHRWHWPSEGLLLTDILQVIQERKEQLKNA
jgi:hypothetical protein